MPLIKRRILGALLLVWVACPVSAQITPAAVVPQPEQAQPTPPLPQSTTPAYCPVNLPEDRGKLHPKRLHLSPKVLHHRDEYYAYMAALGKSDPRQKAAAMEEFVALYPHSKMKIDALEQAMAAYQASGNAGKVADMATRVLQMEPGNLRALAVLVFLARDCATKELAAGKVLSQLAQRGLAALPEWQETQGASLPDGAKLRDEMAAIFAGAAGWGALRARDYGAARQFYEKALATDPKNVQDLYQLAIADLEMTPIDPNGFWYCGKAISIVQLQNSKAAAGMTPYCKARFKRYGGTLEEWDRLVSNTEKDSAPPRDFAKGLSLLANRIPTIVAPLASSEKGDPISKLVPATDKGSRVGAGIGSGVVISPVEMTVIPQTPVGVSPPSLRTVTPVYPTSASGTKIHGLEKLEITIDVDGNVADVSVVNSSGTEFDQQAIAAMRQSTFKPATKDGKPVTSKALVLINVLGMPKPGAGAGTGAAGIMAPTDAGPSAPIVSVSGDSLSSNDFRSRYAWYVHDVEKKIAAAWLVPADANAPAHRGLLSFVIQPDGSPVNVRIEQSSGIPSLDVSAMRSVQRIDAFGPPPTHASVNVEVMFDPRK